MPDTLNREGHRQRMRDAYLSGHYDGLPDHNLLELFLSLVIPRKDVKQLSYDLINTFGGLDGVINASPQNLMTVNGVGENTAVAIACIKDFYRRIDKNRNENIKKINSTSDAMTFCMNYLKNETVEKLIVITLKSDNSIIAAHLVSTGTVNVSPVDMKAIIDHTMRDNAGALIIAHNHPSGNVQPSKEDVNFTLSLRDILYKLNIHFVDHIIVTNTDAISFRENTKFLN